jgi:hypothetical protein
MNMNNFQGLSLNSRPEREKANETAGGKIEKHGLLVPELISSVK